MEWHVSKKKSIRVMAVASGGGHWIQLNRIAPAFAEMDVTFVTVRSTLRHMAPENARFCVVPDATRWNRFRLIHLAFKMLYLIMRYRPQVVISTGAAPGYFALRIGRFFGAKTCWVDSIANTEKLSLSGKAIKKHADLVLTQWPHLVEAPEQGGCSVEFAGAVM